MAPRSRWDGQTLTLQLTFSLSFDPEDTREVSIVCTPAELAGRWEQKHHVVTDEVQSLSAQAGTLVRIHPWDSVVAFASELQIRLDSRAAIQLAVSAYKLRSEGKGPGDLVSLMRILAEKSGEGNRANELKSEAVSRLISEESRWLPKHLLTLRNVDFGKFPNSALLSRAVTRWVEKLNLTTSGGDAELVVISWVRGKAKPAWLNAVGEGLRAALSTESANPAIAATLWSALTHACEEATKVLDLFHAARYSEQQLVDVVTDDIEPGSADALVTELASREWWSLAGQVLARSRPPREALEKALGLNAGRSNGVLLRSALSRGAAAEVVEAVLQNPDVTAIQIAAEKCATTRSVWERFDWLNAVWYRLLEEAIKSNPQVVSLLPSHTTGLRQLIDDKVTDEIVWRVISRTPLANLAAVPSRREAWSLIPTPLLPLILKATADGWLSLFEQREATREQLEAVLAEVVLTKVYGRGYLIRVLDQAPAGFPLYLHEFGFRSEGEAVFFLDDLNRKPNVTLSESSSRVLGELLHSRQWRIAAERGAQMLNTRPDLRPLLAECYSVLGVVDRLWVGWKLNMPVRLSPDEAWAAFESEAITLYPWGPSERELWSRSGGLNEDLLNQDTGRAAWHRCIRELRSGKSPGVQALLKVMSDDYPFNDSLRHLQRQNFAG